MKLHGPRRPEGSPMSTGSSGWASAATGCCQRTSPTRLWRNRACTRARVHVGLSVRERVCAVVVRAGASCGIVCARPRASQAPGSNVAPRWPDASGREGQGDTPRNAATNTFMSTSVVLKSGSFLYSSAPSSITKMTLFLVSLLLSPHLYSHYLC